MAKKYIIKYDIKSLPDGMDLDTLNRGVDKGFILWDSGNGGEEPMIVNIGSEITEIVVKDINA